MPDGAPYRFDVALSFAGDDRPTAERLATLLSGLGIRTFYDAHERAELWGQDLYQHLQEVYRDRARFCVVLVSEAYGKRLWTRHELRLAQSRAFQDHREYILPVRLDDTQLPGLLDTTSYVDLRTTTLEEIAQLIQQKLATRDDASTWPATPTPLAAFSPRLIVAVDAVRRHAVQVLVTAPRQPGDEHDSGAFIRRALAGVATPADVDVEVTCLDRLGVYVSHPWSGVRHRNVADVWPDRPGFAAWMMRCMHGARRGYLTWIDAYSSNEGLGQEIFDDRRSYSRRTIVAFEGVGIGIDGLDFVAVEGHEIETLGVRLSKRP
jgi:hypothetical protein